MVADRSPNQNTISDGLYGGDPQAFSELRNIRVIPYHWCRRESRESLPLSCIEFASRLRSVCSVPKQDGFGPTDGSAALIAKTNKAANPVRLNAL